MSDNIELSIFAIEYALESFASEWEDDQERIKFLKLKINEVPKLALYFDRSRDELWAARQLEMNIKLEKERQRTAESQRVLQGVQIFA